MAKKPRTDRSRKEPAEVICPKCHHTEIIYMPQQEMPMCPDCGKRRMVFRELLKEGKSY
jgi:ribosomal protein S27E